MKAFTSAWHFLLGAVAALSVAAPLAFAQISTEPTAYRLGFATEVANGTANVTIYGHTTNSMGMGSYSGWSTYYGTTSVMMLPGKNYSMTIQSWGNGSTPSNARVVFDPPPGYVVMVENQETLRFKVESSPGVYFSFPPMYPGATITFTIRLEQAPSSRTELPAGASTSLRSGKVIWELGLGNLKNGKPAGAIALRSDGINVNSYKPSGLVYATDSTEVEVINDANGLRQILAPKGLADVIFSTGSPRTMEIRFYERWRVTTKSGSTWQVNDVNAWFCKYVIDTPDASGYDRLRITKTVNVGGQESWRTLLYAPQSGGTWELDDWYRLNGTILRKEKRSFWTGSDGKPMERIEVADHNNQAVATAELQYENKAWGKELIRRVDGISPTLFSASPDLYASGTYPNLTTYYYYHESSSSAGNYGKMKAILKPDGSWERYDYYDDVERLGLVYHRYEPFFNQVTDPLSTDTSKMRITTHDYAYDYTGIRKSALSYAETTESDWPFNPSSRVTVKKREIQHSSPSSPEMHIGLGTTQKVHVETITDYASSGQWVTTVVKRFRMDSDVSQRFTRDLVYSVKNPDGTQESHAYFRGNWYAPWWGFNFSSSGTMVAQFIFHGVAGSDFTSISQSGQDFDIEDIRLIAGKSTVTMIVRDETGEVQYTSESVWTGSGYTLPGSFALIRGGRTSVNALGQVTDVLEAYPHSSATYGVYYDSSYAATVTKGLVTSSTDAMGVVTTFTHDDRGRVVTSTRVGASAVSGVGNAQPDVRTELVYDGDDRLRRVDLGPTGGTKSQTHFKYDAAGRRRWTSAPGANDGSSLESTTTYSADNRTVTATRPGKPALVTTRYIDGRTISITDDSGLGTYWDYWSIGSGVCRVSKTTRTSSGSNQADWEAWDVDWLGRKKQVLSPNVGYLGNSSLDGRSFSYNAKGQLESMSRWNNTGAGNTAPTYRYVYEDMGTVEREGYDVDNDGSLADPATTPSTTDVVTRNVWSYNYTSVNGITAWWLNRASYRYPENSTAVLNGASWTQLTQLDSLTNERSVSQTAAGIVGYDEVLTDESAKTVRHRSYQTGVTSFTETIFYNGRSSAEKSPAGDLAMSTYDAYGRLTRVAGRDNLQVNYAYKGATAFLSATTGYDSTTNGVTYGYDSSSRVNLETLTDNSTRRYAYDAKGRCDRTWGTAVNPTLYTYDAYGRVYQITTYRHDDAIGDSATWPTSLTNPSTTTFDTDLMSGLLLTKTYSEGDQESFSYGAARNLYRVTKTQSQKPTQTREWKFENWSSPGSGFVTDSAWRIRREYLNDVEWVRYSYRRDGSFSSVEDRTDGYGGFSTRTFNYAGSVPGALSSIAMPALFNIGGNQSRLSFLFDNDDGISTGETPGRSRGLRLGTAADPDQYYNEERAYNGSHGMIGSVVFDRAGGMVRTYTVNYKSSSSLVDYATLSAGGTEKFRRGYSYESKRARITSASNSGPSSANHGYYEYAYDNRDRMTFEIRTGSVAQPFDGSTYGNRETFSYADNKQLTGTSLFSLVTAWNRDNPPSQVALPDAARTFGYDSAGNRKTSTEGSGNAVSYSRNGDNQYTAVGGTSLAYAHGNLTSDGVNNYEFNARGEMTRVYNSLYDITNTYDYAGRRVRKQVSKYISGSWTAQSDRRFIYNGWRLVAELEGTTLLRTYTWSSAEADALGAVGGQGNLVAIQEGSYTYVPVYDGRGNITGYVDSDANSLVAAYRYDAYGQMTHYSGGKALDLPLGFKGQYTDREIGLIYHSKRFYHPGLGRFIQRDPIGEAGGLNLYGFGGNDPANSGDYLGMASITYTWTETEWLPLGLWGRGGNYGSSGFMTEVFGGTPYFGDDGWRQPADSFLWLYGPGMDPSSYWQDRMLWVPVTSIRTLTEDFAVPGSPTDGIGWPEGKARPGEDILRYRDLGKGIKVDPQAANRAVILLAADGETAARIIGAATPPPEWFAELVRRHGNDLAKLRKILPKERLQQMISRWKSLQRVFERVAKKLPKDATMAQMNQMAAEMMAKSSDPFLSYSGKKLLEAYAKNAATAENTAGLSGPSGSYVKPAPRDPDPTIDALLYLESYSTRLHEAVHDQRWAAEREAAGGEISDEELVKRPGSGPPGALDEINAYQANIDFINQVIQTLYP